MKQANCDQCHQLVPVNETLSLLGRQLCRPWRPKRCRGIPKGKITADSITRHVDSTVCAQCGTDDGEAELPTLANVPLCSSCERYFRNRPYPAWLKLSFVAPWWRSPCFPSAGIGGSWPPTVRCIKSNGRLLKGDVDKAAATQRIGRTSRARSDRPRPRLPACIGASRF